MTKRLPEGNPIQDAVVLLHSTFVSAVKCEDAVLADKELSSARFAVLWAVEFLDDPVTPTDIARWLNRKTNSITLILDRMEADGLIERIRDMPDRRSLRVVMTPKGKKAFEQSAGPIRELFETIMSGFSKEELWVIAGLLRRFRQGTVEFLRSKEVATVTAHD